MECPDLETGTPEEWCWHCLHPPGSPSSPPCPCPGSARPPWWRWWPGWSPRWTRTPPPRPDQPGIVFVSQLYPGPPKLCFNQIHPRHVIIDAINVM